MARSKIKELVVEIVGDDKKLQQASGTTTAALKRIGSSALRMAKQLGAAGLAGAAGLTALVGKSIAAADEAGKTAASIGTTVEELTALRHAADLSGVSQENLDKALGRMARTSSDAANGLQTAKRGFEFLGISVTKADGSLRGQQEILGDVSEAFSQMEDGTKKTALAQEIFGRSGTQLIPMLNAGRDGIAEMTDEAEQLGLVIDGKTSKSAADFRDNLTRLQAIGRGFINQLMQRVVPILLDLSEIFFDAGTKAGGFGGAIDAVEATLRGAIATGALLRGTFLAIGDVLAGVAAAISFVVKGQFRNAWESIKIGAADASERITDTKDEVVFAWEGMGDAAEENAERVNAATEPATAGYHAMANAIRDAKEQAEQLRDVVRDDGIQGEGLAKTVVPEIRLPDMVSPTRGLQMYRDEVSEATGETEDLATVGDEMEAIAQRGIESFADFASGAGQAIKQFVNQAISDLTRLLFHRAFTSILNVLAPGSGVAASALPSFASGGVVPGPMGSPQLIVAHGGETVVPTGGSNGGSFRISFDRSSLPPLQPPMTPREAARDTWWRELHGHLQVDYIDRGGRP